MKLDKINKNTLHQLKSLLINRRNPGYPDLPLMQAVELHPTLQCKNKINLLKDLCLTDVNINTKNHVRKNTNPKELIVNAHWKSACEEPTGNSNLANIFGDLGCLLIKNLDELQIPAYNILQLESSFLKKYGAKLHSINSPIKLSCSTVKIFNTLYLVEYKFDKHFIKYFALNRKLGGGIALETHPFHHLYIPMNKDCQGALILGKQIEDRLFSFIAVKIPFGFCVELFKNSIHGDWFFIGNYTIALTTTDQADAVLIRKENNKKDLINVRLIDF